MASVYVLGDAIHLYKNTLLFRGNNIKHLRMVSGNLLQLETSTYKVRRSGFHQHQK